MNTNDHANKISDNTQIYAYQSLSISTSKRASIDHKAQAIHHRTILQAIPQNIKDTIKPFQENRIFYFSFWCNSARSNGIDRVARIKIQKYSSHSEYVASNTFLILVRIK